MANLTKLQDVHELRNTLYKIHKCLLDHQSNETSIRLQRRLDPYELWQMATEDSDFDWLRVISSLIVTMDEEIEMAKDLTNLDIDYMAIYLRSLFFFPLAQHMDFYEKIRSIKEHNATLLHLLKDLFRNVETVLGPSNNDQDDLLAP